MKIAPLSFFIWVVLCLLPFGLSAQTDHVYRTIKIRGHVTLAANGKKLQRESKFNAASKLIFSALTDALVVVDEKAGTYLITPDASLKQYRSKALAVSVDSRPGNILSDPQLREFFLRNDSLLLLNGSFSLLLGNKAFPMDDTHLFYMQYTWNGQTINKMLPSRGDTLFIRADSLFQVDLKPIDPAAITSPFYLFYFDTLTQVSTAYPEIGVPLYIIREPESRLREELETLFDALQITDREQRLLAAANYLTEMYGRPGETELWHWLH